MTCGITFTFGGLRIDTDAQVLDIDDAPIPGLYAPASWSAGSSTSTTRAAPASSSGAVFGRIAGRSASPS